VRIVLKIFPAFVLAVVFSFLLPQKSSAIPAFSRQYGTSCMTCHVDFPKLNDFGKAFKDAGFKFPEGDEDQIKVAPVMLGGGAKAGFPEVGLAGNDSGHASGVIKDTVVVPTYGRASVDFTADQPGLTLFHCHIQQHMDFGFKALLRYS
jgi:Multicopper oxidase